MKDGRRALDSASIFSRRVDREPLTAAVFSITKPATLTAQAKSESSLENSSHSSRSISNGLRSDADGNGRGDATTQGEFGTVLQP